MDHPDPRVPTGAHARHLFIVSRDAPDLYHRLAGFVVDEPAFGAILDRRAGARRSVPGPCAPERRVRPWVDEDLRLYGCAFVSMPCARRDEAAEPR